MTNNAEIAYIRILIPLMIGIYCSHQLDEVQSLPIIVVTGSLFLVLCGINFCYKTLRAYRFKYLTGIMLFLFILAFGSLLGQVNKDKLRPNYFTKYQGKLLKVWINDEPQKGSGTIRFTANVTRVYTGQDVQQTTGKLLIIINNDHSNAIHYGYGEELLVNANYIPVTPPYNPAEFDFKGWLQSKNIYEQAFIRQNEVIKTGFNRGNPIIKYALHLRKEQIEIYNHLIKNKEAFAIASTLILGYRAGLSDETMSAFSKTGTIHALSVSGMHVGIIYIVLHWILGFLDKNRILKILKIVVICLLIWSYALLTGFSPSVLRSVVMLTVYILAKSFNKHINGYNILAFTAFCLLLYDPFLFWDVGFQLSFLAVLGLIYLQPKIHKFLYFKHRILDWLWSSISLSIAAQVATFPLSIYYFHQFPIYFILSNLFILLPITLLMYLGISILLFKIYFLAPVFEWIILFMSSGLNWISELPFSSINQIWLNKFELLLLSLAIVLGLVALVRRKKYSLITSIFLFLCFHLSLAKGTIIAKRQQKILFFTLQKGYAAAFISKQDAIIVTNLLPADKSFQFFIEPALDQLKIKKHHFINWDRNFDLKSFSMKHHQIKFFNYHILLVDTSFNHKILVKTQPLNIVWLHKNPQIKLTELQNYLTFKHIVIDASNYILNIKNFSDEANKIGIEAHVLKKNKAYLIDLNH